MPIERICKTCGNHFFVDPYRVREGTGNFCSLNCFGNSPENKARCAEMGKYERTPEIRTKYSESRRGKSCPHTEEQNRKIGKANSKPHPWTTEWNLSHKGRFIGERNPNFGKHHTEKTKEDIRQAHLDYLKKLQTEPELLIEFRKKQQKGLHKRPTKPEQHLIDILNKHFAEFKYNGGCSLGIVLGGLVPDFVNIDGKKQVIEVFGDYWHNRENMPWHQTELGRIMAYNSVGYKTLIIWEHNLKEKTEVEIVDMVKAFTGRRKKCLV